MRADVPEVDILVIEDDLDIAELLGELLRNEGYRVATRGEGTRLEQVVAAPPRMLLLDLMLPQVDGAEICRRLRAEEATRTLPIVIMTAASPIARMQRLRGCVYDALLTKPFDVDEVLAVAARYLRPVIVPAPIGADGKLHAGDEHASGTGATWAEGPGGAAGR